MENEWIFNPISGNSQQCLCALLKLPLQFTHSAQSVEPLSNPTKIVPIIGDGNCLFRSFSYVITGRQTYHNLLRQKIVDHMQTIENVLQPHIKSSVVDYLARSQMRSNGIWGTDVDILTATCLLNTDIYVYAKYGRTFKWSRFSPTMLNQSPSEIQASVYVQNTSGIHYDVVVGVAGRHEHINVTNSCNLTIDFLNSKDRCQTQCLEVKETPLLKLSHKLERLGLKPLDVGGSGDCFFRAVSHQIYQNPDYHMKVRSAGVNYIQLHPEQFIESIANDCWLDYIHKMSMQGTWCDGLIVQAVSDALNCKIQIIESADGFPDRTVIHPVNPKETPNTIFIGHLDEFHYVSTVKSVGHMSSHISDHMYTRVEQLHSDITSQCNLSLHRFSKCKTAGQYNYVPINSTNKNNPKLSEVRCDKKCQNIKQPETKNYKRKRQENNVEIQQQYENDCKKSRREEIISQKDQNQGKGICNENIFDSYQTEMSLLIKSFHNSIQLGPEYICTCCDQLWFKSSVKQCSVNLYKSCSPNILNISITGRKSVDNREWICWTCDWALKNGKLPACAKANKMTFPVKPDVLNLTPLEERLISPRIPFMQICELPRGGQLSIHGNVVNVPADVNSTVHLLPRLLSESQTIPVKLKRRLSYKHHYKFESVRPRKVLEGLQYLVQTSKLFQDEGIQIDTDWIDTLNSREDKIF